MIKLKDELILTIEKLVFKGAGLGNHEGFKIFVPGTLPGDVVNIRINKKKRRYAEGKCIEFIEKSPLRKTNTCTHFPQCGGCQMIDVPYSDQAKIKESILTDTIVQFFPEMEEKRQPILSSESQRFYRNKMEFAFGQKEGTLTLGLKKRACFDIIVPIHDCQLQSEQSNSIIKDSVAFFKNTPLTPWDYDNNTGDLRHLMVRHSKTKDTYMLMIITGSTQSDIIENYVKTITKKHPNITSIYQSINPSPGDTAQEPDIRHHHGDTHIVERLGDIEFKISPQSFFQTNTKQAEVLYQTVADIAHLDSTTELLDLYCGTGSIGLFLSKYVKSVQGIEEVAPAIEDAKKNAERNGITNATFVCGRVKNILKFDPPKVDCIVIDPPRCGMVPKALMRMASLGAPQLIYVSCNPSTLMRDLKEICTYGYQVETIQPVDMFPNTFHLECVTRLTKI